jgi:hypothetical protein
MLNKNKLAIKFDLLWLRYLQKYEVNNELNVFEDISGQQD